MIRQLALLLAGAFLAQPAAAHDPVDLSALVGKLLPSVVSISTISVIDTPAETGKAAVHTRRRGMGTGFVIGANGLIVTNRHVIEGASEVTVTLSDGTNLAATVLSRALIDIALLRVAPDAPLPVVKWGDSNALRQGQPVFAIGNPLGYSSSVTAGIVSALERDIRTTPFDDYIQTDAPINQGNSGGPLFNLDGQVIGVNTALQSQGNGGSIGIGFSIPSNDAQFVIARLLEHGRVKPGWVGARVQKLTPLIADGAGMPRNERHAHGVIVTGIESGGTAAGKLRPGDVIVGVGEATILDARTFNRSVAILDVDSTAKFIFWRNGKRMELDIPIGDSPEDIKAGQGMTAAQAAMDYTDPPDLGLGLAPLTTDIRARYEIPTDITGVAVVSVDPRSKASEAGIEPGDVIQRVLNGPVGSVREFWQLVDGARRDRRTRLLMLIKGPTGERWVTLPSA